MEIVHNILKSSSYHFSSHSYLSSNKKRRQEIFPTYETKEGAKYIECLAFQYLAAKRKIWTLKRMIQKHYRNIRQESLR